MIRYTWLCGKNYAYIPMAVGNMELILEEPLFKKSLMDEVTRAMPTVDHIHEFNMDEPMAMSHDNNVFYDCLKGATDV